MIRQNCRVCLGELHQQPAQLNGPPDLVSRVRQHSFCRKCYKRILELLPILREHAERDRGTANHNGGMSMRAAAAAVARDQPIRRNTTRSAG